MKLFRRTKWKPKQKLRKEDLPFLLAEYRVANTAFHISLTLTASLLGITIAAYFTAGSNPDVLTEIFVRSSAWAAFVFLFLSVVLAIRVSRIAEVLGIKKRLKKYGID